MIYMACIMSCPMCEDVGVGGAKVKRSKHVKAWAVAVAVAS